MTNGDRLQFDGKVYLSAKVAGEYSGYTPDYLARLCREGNVLGRMVGRAWYVEEDSFFRFLAATNKRKLAGKHALSELRRKEYRGGEENALRFIPYELVRKAGALVAAVFIVAGAYALLPSSPGFIPAFVPDAADGISSGLTLGENVAAAAGEGASNVALGFNILLEDWAEGVYRFFSTVREAMFSRLIEPFCPR